MLRVGETPLELLSLDQSAHFDAQFVLAPSVGPDDQVPCSIVRRRLIDGGWIEQVTVTNHRHETAALQVRLEVDADFADLFEVKDGTVTDRAVSFEDRDNAFSLSYCRDDYRRSVTVVSNRPATISRRGFAFSLELAAGEEWSTTFAVSHDATVARAGIWRQRTLGELRQTKAAELDAWLADAPVLRRRTRVWHGPTGPASATSGRFACTRT